MFTGVVDRRESPALHIQTVNSYWTPSCHGLMDARPLDLDTYLVFARPAASTGFWFDLNLKCSSEEKMETEPGSKAINKIHSQEGFQWSGLLHSLPRQGAAEHHTWQEKYTETHFAICVPFPSLFFWWKSPVLYPSNWKVLYLCQTGSAHSSHVFFPVMVVVAECNTTLTRHHPPPPR